MALYARWRLCHLSDTPIGTDSCKFIGWQPGFLYTGEPLVYIGPAEGLPKEEWKLRTARELLDLKICDMACGSGAFLVQACRYMAARLLEAWQEATTKHTNDTKENLDKPTVIDPKTGELVFPSSSLSSDSCISWFTLPAEDGERLVIAMRMIAQRCLYGVDINPLAVEMAKLSLWLLTLAKDKPFEFLDHAIRCGDSLVGIHNTEQLKRFNLAAGSGVELPVANIALQFMDKQIKEAVTLRRQITEMQANTVEDVEAQDRMLREANETFDRLKFAADLLISAEFVPGSAADKRAARDDAAIKVAVHFHDSDLPTFRREVQKALGGQVTFHWPLEFPEVMVERGGFDAIVGNPPFMGGKWITGTLGDTYREYLVDVLAKGRRGHADLCAYFVLRAMGPLRENAQLGFLTTNTISQGDTREVCLDYLLSQRCTLPRVVPNHKWPGAANLEVSLVWACNGHWHGRYSLSDNLVLGITSYLVAPGAITGPPKRLVSNSSVAFQGSNLRGIGFVVSPEEAQSWIKKDSRNKQVLFPYLVGEDFNRQPNQSPSRWVINFFDWDRETAESFADLFAIAEQKVLPARQEIPHKATREKSVKSFWRYEALGKELYRTINGMERVLFHGYVSKYLCFGFVPNGFVYGGPSNVFAIQEDRQFCVLQSDIHETWVREYCSTLESRLRYVPSDVFETFPFPDGASPTSAYSRTSTLLEARGKAFHDARQNIMVARHVGLTKTYNHFHDSADTNADIQKLRQLHVEMDHAVAAAYGWTDLDLGHGFQETKQGVRYTISEPARREVLARLLKLNHERYAEEVKLGLHEKKKGGAGRVKGGGKKKTQDEAGGLFD